jgi:hypothetical protein
MWSSLREKTSAKYLSKIPRGRCRPNGAVHNFFEKLESTAARSASKTRSRQGSRAAKWMQRVNEENEITNELQLQCAVAIRKDL